MDVEAYIKSLSVGKDEKRRTRSDLTTFLKILASHGRTFPEESDYQEYRTLKSATDKTKKATDDRISRIKRYFDTLQKGEAQMTIPETPATETAGIFPTEPVRTGDSAEDSAVTTEPVPDTDHQPETPEAPATLEASRMGRPRKSPEGRNKKLTIYITEELEEDVKDLARIVGTTTPDYVFRLIEREAKNRADALDLIRKMRLENA